MGQDWQKDLEFLPQTACSLVDKPTNVDGENPYLISRHIQKVFLAEIDSPVETLWLGENSTDRSIPISTRHD
ncbi:MAG: hypothetical protein MK132_04185 [Lentisphaerales bacterium]|nr:hypothetical protein [Lentisphaerales bacterium]